MWVISFQPRNNPMMQVLLFSAEVFKKYSTNRWLRQVLAAILHSFPNGGLNTSHMGGLRPPHHTVLPSV